MSSIPPHIEAACDLVDALGPISHDLHNIFNGMVLQVAIASRGLPEDAREKVTELKTLALEASRKLLQVDTKRQELNVPREAVDLSEVIQNALGTVNQNKGESNISILVEPAKDGPRALSHFSELTRLLTLILRCSRNALQDQADGEIRVDIETKADSIMVCVEDNGPLIEEDRLIDFYDPFRPLRPGEDGFDRAASYSLAKRLQADLQMENLSPRGLRVKLELEAVK